MRFHLALWRYFLDSTPVYLARHYWWAYLWRPAIWFFDHQAIINLILFGQYRRLMRQTLACLEDRPDGRILQLSCVYGKLTPKLLDEQNGSALYLLDVATAQLEKSLGKLESTKREQLLAMRMNAESLGLRTDTFATVLIFFLLHEMPAEARRRALTESLRILQPGGRLVVTEYGAEPRSHWLYRFWPMRCLLTYWEPFLEGFWREDLNAVIQQRAAELGKKVSKVEEHAIFGEFYRVVVYERV